MPAASHLVPRARPLCVVIVFGQWPPERRGLAPRIAALLLEVVLEPNGRQPLHNTTWGSRETSNARAGEQRRGQGGKAEASRDRAVTGLRCR